MHQYGVNGNRDPLTDGARSLAAAAQMTALYTSTGVSWLSQQECGSCYAHEVDVLTALVDRATKCLAMCAWSIAESKNQPLAVVAFVIVS